MITAVVVTYGPDERTAELLHALATQVDHIVVVDNGSTLNALKTIDGAIDEVGAQLIALNENTGIAHAQNIGILHAKALGTTHVLLFDQDSLPAPDMVTRLKARLEATPEAGAVGPYIAENKPGGDELVYVDRRSGPRRATPEELTQPAVDAAFLLASGCLIPMDVLDAVGPMNAKFFIDHVDLEWCLRARKLGYRMVVDTAAHLDHSLGDETVKLPFRKQPVHVHGPVRCYYLARNTIFMLRSGLLPVAWRAGYVVWLAKFVAFHSLLADRRRLRIRELTAGILDGVLRRGGPRL